jgi:hypothetical protein
VVTLELHRVRHVVSNAGGFAVDAVKRFLQLAVAVDANVVGASFLVFYVGVSTMVGAHRFPRCFSTELSHSFKLEIQKLSIICFFLQILLQMTRKTHGGGGIVSFIKSRRVDPGFRKDVAKTREMLAKLEAKKKRGGKRRKISFFDKYQNITMNSRRKQSRYRKSTGGKRRSRRRSIHGGKKKGAWRRLTKPFRRSNRFKLLQADVNW